MRRVSGSAGLRLSRCWMRPARRAPRWSAERRAAPAGAAVVLRLSTAVRTRLSALRLPSFEGSEWDGLSCSLQQSSDAKTHRENEIAFPSPLVREGKRARRCLTLWIGNSAVGRISRRRNPPFLFYVIAEDGGLRLRLTRPTDWRGSANAPIRIAERAPAIAATRTPRRFAAYFSDNASPLKSRLTIRPFCSPVSVSTAPFWLARTTACTPLTAAAPAPPWA